MRPSAVEGVGLGPEPGVEQLRLPLHHQLIQFVDQRLALRAHGYLVAQRLLQLVHLLLAPPVLLVDQLEGNRAHLRLRKGQAPFPLLLHRRTAVCVLAGVAEVQQLAGGQLDVEGALDGEGARPIALGINDAALEKRKGALGALLLEAVLGTAVFQLQVAVTVFAAGTLHAQVFLEGGPVVSQHTQQVDQLGQVLLAAGLQRPLLTQRFLPHLAHQQLVAPLCHSLLILRGRFLGQFEEGGGHHAVGVIYFLAEDLGVILGVGREGVGEQRPADEAVLIGLDLGHQNYYTSLPPQAIIGSAVGNAWKENLSLLAPSVIKTRVGQRRPAGRKSTREGGGELEGVRTGIGSVCYM